MRNQLRFDLEVIKNNYVALIVIGMIDVVYLLMGLSFGYIPMSVVVGAVILVNTLAIIILLEGINMYLNRKGQFVSLLSLCLYYPTRRRDYILSRAVITLAVILFQCLITGTAMILGTLTKPGFIGVWSVAILFAVVIFSGLIASSFCIITGVFSRGSQPVLMLVLIFYSGFFGGVIGGVSENFHEITIGYAGIALLCAVLVWLASLGAASLIARKISV